MSVALVSLCNIGHLSTKAQSSLKSEERTTNPQFSHELNCQLALERGSEWVEPAGNASSLEQTV